MTTKAVILQAIRHKCLDCSGGQPGEVRKCPVTTCDLWRYRFGRDPSPSRTRGFAKPDGYTGGSSSGTAEVHLGSTPSRREDKPPVYTSSFAERGATGQRTGGTDQGAAP